LSKDEGALFQIANEFSVRHASERQKGDYDAVFLEWFFWWYLATIELTDRVIMRRQVHEAEALSQGMIGRAKGRKSDS
jgi:hypothetical protein